MFTFVCKLLVIIWPICTTISGQSTSTCESIRIRPDVKNLSPQEWQIYLNIFKQMYREGVFENMARIHHQNFRTIHDNPQFLFWHRYFVWDFENILRRYNSNLTLPYWVSRVINCEVIN